MLLTQTRSFLKFETHQNSNIFEIKLNIIHAHVYQNKKLHAKGSKDFMFILVLYNYTRAWIFMNKAIQNYTKNTKSPEKVYKPIENK